MNYFNSVKPTITTSDELNKKILRNDFKTLFYPILNYRIYF